MTNRRLLVLAAAASIACLSGCASSEDVETPASPDQASATEVAAPAWQQLGQRLADGDRSAIAELRERFDSAVEPGERQSLAWLLVLTGSGDGRAYDYLVERARAAVESDLPYPLPLTDNLFAEVLSGGSGAPPTPEFLAWCRERDLDPAAAAGEALSHLDDVKWLGMTEDPRAIDLLIRGLASPNLAVVAQSAHGLGRIGDLRGIEPIRRAASRVPPPVAEFLGFTLLYFDDADARAAAKSLIRPEALETYASVAVQDRMRRQSLKAVANGEGREQR